MEEMKTTNAIIESVSITSADHGLLSAWVHVRFGGGGQGFGGYCLYLPKSFTHHKLESCAGHFIWRVMEIAGVEEWAKCAGKAIRIKHSHSKIQAIGHIINDDWFDPSEDFKGIS